ncbi:MAG TPA: hypothetical protein VMT08_36740 [Bradyrhizobium sp.]|nr:hypothetical protein [Bradyrhizobium sp.]
MARKALLTLSVSATLATISLAPTAVFAQFPGPPPIAAGGPPAFASPPPMGLGGAAHVGLGGPAPRLGAGAGPRGDPRALGGVRAGPAVARSVQARSASVSYSRSESFSHGYGGRRYGYGETYAAGAYADYAYGSSNDGYYSDSDCYYAYRRHRRALICN